MCNLSANAPNAVQENIPAEYALFGERGARAVVSVTPASLARVNAITAQWGVTAREIGYVTRGDFSIQYNGNAAIKAPVDSFRSIWAQSLAKRHRKYPIEK